MRSDWHALGKGSSATVCPPVDVDQVTFRGVAPAQSQSVFWFYWYCRYPQTRSGALSTPPSPLWLTSRYSLTHLLTVTCTHVPA